MELSLAIDQGNSAVKLSVFDGEAMLVSERFDGITLEDLGNVLARFDISRSIYSSVVGDDEKIVAFLKRRTRRCYVLDENLPIPLEIGYATPHTLGHDRIAVAVGASSLKPDRDILIVDSGTAITYDVVTSGRRFLGGNIAPGVQTRFSALKHFCAKLPLVGSEGDVPVIGYDTPTAIRAGVVRGVAAEVRYMAEQLKKEFRGITVMLTGGDSGLIAPLLDLDDVEINYNLVTIGLNRILQYNELL